MEKAGANIALIGDTVEEDSEVFIMSDDGSGHSINIPSFFIDRKTSDAFKLSYAEHSHIIIKVVIETARSDQVAVDLWYSTPFDLSTETLNGMRSIIPLYGDNIEFHVNIKSKSCFYCDEEEKKKDCISNGHYCAIAPISKDEKLKTLLDTFDGRALMKQSLLTKCVQTILYEYGQDNISASITKGLDYMI